MKTSFTYYIPDEWVLLKIPGGIYKVFGVERGSYLYGNQWKLNSGIKHVDFVNDVFKFHGYSQSIYECYKHKYGIHSMYGRETLDRIIDMARHHGVEVLESWQDCELLKQYA